MLIFTPAGPEQNGQSERIASGFDEKKNNRLQDVSSIAYRPTIGSS